MEEDFVAGIEQGAQGQVQRLGDADGYQDFGRAVVPDAKVLEDVAGDRFPEARKAEIGGVAGAAFLQGINGGLADVPWGIEVGLADAERDDVLHRLHDFEKVADARAGDVADVMGDVFLEIHAVQLIIEKGILQQQGCRAGRVQGVTARRGSSFSRWRRVPFSL